VNAAQLEAIRLAIAAGDRTPRGIYLAHRLQYVVRFPTFRRWVGVYRRELRDGDVELGEALSRGSWGSRDLRRLRRKGLEGLSHRKLSVIAGLSLTDAAEGLRVIANKLIDVANAFFRQAERGKDGDA
jgi:hypothetical protein